MEINSIQLDNKVLDLLKYCGLPTSDLELHENVSRMFWGVHAPGKDTTLIGMIGIEMLGEISLVRSLAVSPDFREQGMGGRLLAFAENAGLTYGIQTLFLLTQGAVEFFNNHGYSIVARQNAPDAIKASQQFSLVCPLSAALMSKSINVMA